MSLARATPFPFSPVGASDALDSSNVAKGAMTALTNLVPTPGTRNLWECRPAAIELVDFTMQGGPFSSGFSSGFYIGLITPAAIVCEKVVGNIVYGLISSGTYAGHDEPFAYNLLTGALLTVTGQTLANTPVTQATTGDWAPPTMDVIGTKLIVTHPGYTGSGGMFFGWFDITTPTAPAWSAGNTTTNALSTAPTAVKQFGGRAYYAVNPSGGQPALYASDVLAATVITNANQVLTFDDNQTLTALGALPLDNQLGGIIQALIVFKGAAVMYQITGDYALTAGWSKNTLNMATGTLAPWSICPTPLGLAFVSPEGLRVIDFNAHVSEPIGEAGNGITTALIYALTPSRIAAAANANVIRISVQNGYATGSPNQEYWYHLNRKCWSGPHSFPATCISPWNNTFVMAAVGVDAKLFKSDVAQSSTSTFVEDDDQMTFSWQTAMLPDTQQMCANNILETTLNMALAAGITVGVSALNQDGVVLDSVTITPTGTTTQWGNFQWGQAQWLGAANSLYPRELQWTVPVVFRRLAILATGNCASGIKIGDMFLRYEQLGYLQQDAA